MYDVEGEGSPTQNALMKVAKLLDTYLAEIAPDANLTINKFIALAEILPEHARSVDDGLYRAVDVFLKVFWNSIVPSLRFVHHPFSKKSFVIFPPLFAVE